MKDTDVKNYLKIDVILIILLFVPAFIQPIKLFGAYKQLVIGTIVNTGLFLCSKYIDDKKKIIAFSTLPSISSIGSGLLFAGLTKWSIIMIPFIWMGNLSLIYLSKILDKKYNYYVSRVASIILKVAVIYIGFLIVSRLFSFPQPVVNTMNKAMGVIQLCTATCGFIVSTIILGLNKKEKKN